MNRFNWSIKDDADVVKLAVNRFRRYLEQHGFRPSSITSYTYHVEKYLRFAGTDRPSEKALQAYRDNLFDRHLARSTLNNSAFATVQYHKMLGEAVKIPILSRNEILPYYFTEDEIARFFSVIHNLKHLCMFQVLFCACLRASELCNIDDADLDLDNLTLRIKEGKGGRDGYALISNECARHLRQYLSIRPRLEIDGRQPLFFTEYGNRWNQGGLSRIYYYYKADAHIEKKGGLHVFARHSAATLMTSRGVPLNIIQQLLRHRDIRSTLRYAHVDSAVARQWYNKTMRIDG